MAEPPNSNEPPSDFAGGKPPQHFSLRNRKQKEEPSTEELLANINRSLPFSDEAEKGVLSGILQDPSERLSESRVQIPLEAFYHSANRIVYETLQTFYDRNIPLDITTLTHALREKQVIDKVGGPGAVTELYSFIPVSAHYEFYKKVLLDKHMLRQMIHACSLNIHYAYEHGREHIDEDVDGEIDKAEQRILAVRESTKSSDGIKPIREHVLDAIEEIEYMLSHPGELRGLSTGFSKLDGLCAGLQGSEMFVIAARPSMGKTALALCIAESVALTEDQTVAVFSLEMSGEELTQRMLCSVAMVDASRMRSGRLSPDDWPRVSQAADRLSKAPIFIDDSEGMTVAEMRTKARRLKARHGLGLIVVDYIQLMEGAPNLRRRDENRVQELSAISRGLKMMARDLEVPIIVVSQLNRSPDARNDKRPMLSDLRESGAIEQDADMVLLIYRDDYYEPDSESKGIAEVNVAKHRNGPTDRVKLAFMGTYAKFASLAKDHER